MSLEKEDWWIIQVCSGLTEREEYLNRNSETVDSDKTTLHCQIELRVFNFSMQLEFRKIVLLAVVLVATYIFPHW